MDAMINKEMNKSLSKMLSKKHIDSLPPDLVGRVFQSGLTVVDRLHCERVSPRWKWIVGAFAWSEQRKLDREVVFEGPTDEDQLKFTHANLISLLHCVAGPNLVELNFRWFVRGELDPAFIGQIVESLKLFPNLSTLNIFGFDLEDFVDHLPYSLRNLEIWGPISVQSLRELSIRCPNLEVVPFANVDGANFDIDIVNEFMGKFPSNNKFRQKTLDLCFLYDLPNNATLEAIGRQKELVELSLAIRWDFDDGNERAFEAMAVGCKSLRKIYIRGVHQMTERALLHLAKMPSLTVLDLDTYTALFTDSVLKAIAKRGLLKRLKVVSDELTDEGIVYLLDHCKSLVSLELHYCPQITERSLEAVVAEVHRRHGMHPLALPSGPDDKGIFYFECRETKIDEQKAREMAAENPWLEMTWDPHRVSCIYK